MTLLDFLCVTSAEEMIDICDTENNNINVLTQDMNIRDYSKFVDTYGNKIVRHISSFSSGGFQVEIEL